MSRLRLHKRITKGVSFLTNMLLPGTSFWGDLALEWTTRFKEKLHKEKKLIRRVGGLLPISRFCYGFLVFSRKLSECFRRGFVICLILTTNATKEK